MNKPLLIFLIIFFKTILSQAQAEEVFKCLVNGVTVYQADPCPATAVKKSEIEIKQEDPAKEAAAAAQLKAWEADFNKRDMEEKRLQMEEQSRQAAVNAMNRAAMAEEELARQRYNYNGSFYGYGSPYYYNLFPGGYYPNFYQNHYPGGYGQHFEHNGQQGGSPPHQGGHGLFRR